MLSDPDQAKRENYMKAMMQMKKPDIVKLRSAFER